jgi:hypothetical protein
MNQDPTLGLPALALPILGQPLEGGTFVGLTTRKDGTHCAVVLLPGFKKDVNWDDATAWAAEQGGELPSRHVAAMLFANVNEQLNPYWHWTSDELSASYAWDCSFDYGLQSYYRKGFEGSAVAVRLIPLTA